MKICIAQTRPFKGDIKKNCEAHLTFIEKAAENNAEIIVFPELSLTGYEPELAKELATNIDDKRFKIFQETADTKNIIICLGIPLNSEHGVLISMLIFQPKKTLQVYSKQHLHSDEFEFFCAGNKQLFLEKETDKIVFAICYETSISKHTAFAKKNEANIYIASVLNYTECIDKDLKRLSNIAKNNNMTVFMSNYVGISGGYNCAGKSAVWDQNGVLKAQLNEKDQGLLIYDTSKAEVLETIYFKN